MAPHRHLLVDVTATSARTNTNVLRISARLPLPGIEIEIVYNNTRSKRLLSLCPPCTAQVGTHITWATDIRAHPSLGPPPLRYPRAPLPGSLALEAQHGKLDADLCASALLGTIEPCKHI
jgi:hypothetical protein